MSEVEKLRRVGEALFGAYWQTSLATVLKVSSRTVRYWAAGTPVPATAWDDIAELCRKRGGALITWADKLNKENKND